MEKLKVGKIVNTHGLKGELKVKSLSDFEETRFLPGAKLFLDDHGDQKEWIIKSSRFHKNHYLITIEGLEDINLVEKYKGLDLYGLKDDIELDEGEFLYQDLIGLEAYSTDNELIGKITSLIDNGAQDILVIEGEKKVMVPFVDAFIDHVELDNKKVFIKVIEGLI